MVLQFVSLLMALSTVMGLAAVMPFFAVLADPTLIDSQPPQWLWRFAGHHETEFPASLAGGLHRAAAVSAILNLCGSFAMGRFAFAVGDRIREALFTEYLRATICSMRAPAQGGSWTTCSTRRIG